LDNHKSEVYVGLNWNEVRNFIPASGCVIITDDNVYKIYGKLFPDFPVISIKPGEDSKNIGTIVTLAEKLLDEGIDRTGFILGIGGGVVCDITGFLASIYMRGINFGFISTTLLSQVDASVGGKNAVNIGKIKNILGCFRQPRFVICDPDLLLTLPDDEYLSGLGELVKMGLILDYNLFEKIENNIALLMSKDADLLESLISDSVELKASVVREDEKEISGKRMILNFGHTFGHVIETVASMKHGFAVAAGMVIASGISEKLGLIGLEEFQRIKSLLEKLNLLKKYSLDDNYFQEMLLKDKKKQGSLISFVLLQSPGRAVVRKMTVYEIMNLYRSIKKQV